MSPFSLRWMAVAGCLLAGGAALAAGPAGTRKAAAARAQRRIAFLGLRPATDRTLGQTAIALLPEAQRLRALGESVVEVLTGATVLRHDDLRAAVGRTYLADLFDCGADDACQLRVAAPLARQGVATAILGEYFADGTTLRMRVRLLDLATMRVAEQTSFALDRSRAETLGPWQEALRPLLKSTGRLKIVANVSGTACTIDGRACQPWPAEALDLDEGEHVLELSRAGYRRVSRVVSVKRGEEVRIAIALEELPVQVQKPPDPAARLPTFAAPTEETQIRPFGSIRLAALYDDVNDGDREDVHVPPEGTPRSASVVFFPRPAVIGIGMQAPGTESGWALRGGYGLALVRGELPEFDSAFVEVVKPESGFRLMLGWGASIVSGLTAGTLTLPEGFGDLAPGMVGVTVSRSLGRMVLETFVGKHKGMFDASPQARAATPLPFFGGRVAYVDEATKGRLYGEDYPLTVSFSGIYGQERVGLAGEQEWAAAEAPIPNATFAVAPLLEDLPVWLASAELFVPFAKSASLAGEVWYGQSVHRFEGALWQTPRVDPTTGRHRALRSRGGWAQVAVGVATSFELRLVAGLDRAVDGLDFGLSVGGGPGIRENRLAALDAVWYAMGHLTLGAQLHAVQTIYADPTDGSPRVLGAALTSRLTF